MDLCDLLYSKINWTRSEFDTYIFEASIHGGMAKIRLNDFPEENIATLFFGSQSIEIEGFPNNWTLPPK